MGFALSVSTVTAGEMGIEEESEVDTVQSSSLRLYITARVEGSVGNLSSKEENLCSSLL